MESKHLHNSATSAKITFHSFRNTMASDNQHNCAAPGMITYFVVKSYNKHGLEKSKATGEWACSDRTNGPQPRNILGQ